MDKINVFIISPQLLFRQGIEHALSSAEDIEISGAAEVNEEALSVIDTSPPDVALVDIDAPSDSSLKLTRKIKRRFPNAGLVVLSSNPDDAQLFQALKAQAAAYLSKEINAGELVDIIRRVARGEHPINESLTTRPKVAEQVLQQFRELYWRGEAEGVISPLTAREKDVLNYMAQGYPNKQISIRVDGSRLE